MTRAPRRPTPRFRLCALLGLAACAGLVTAPPATGLPTTINVEIDYMVAAGHSHKPAATEIKPGLNGRQVAEGVRQFRPTIRTLYMSGYTDDMTLRHGVLEPGVSFLQKPLTPQALTRKVRQSLDASRERR